MFLDRVKEAFQKDSQLRSLLMDEYFSQKLAESHLSWRRAITTAINYGVPIPAFSSALAYYDGFRCPRLPANLLQVRNLQTMKHTSTYVSKNITKTFHRPSAISMEPILMSY